LSRSASPAHGQARCGMFASTARKSPVSHVDGIGLRAAHVVYCPQRETARGDMRRPRQLQQPDCWNAKRLKQLIDSEFRDESILVLANRAPFRHDRAPDGNIELKRSSGGLVTALEPLIEACAGVWVAHGSGTADRIVADADDGINVPPARPRYRQRHVWLQPDEE